jgi:hypothetical protein
VPDEWKLGFQPRRQLVVEEAGVFGRIGVLHEPIPRMQERQDRLGDLTAVDEVVEYHLGSGVLQEFAAVMHNEQRVRLGATEPSWQVHGHRTIALQSAAFHNEVGELPWYRVDIWKGPLRCDVAI